MDHNPYAPPQAAVGERFTSHAGICRQGRLLHLARDALLPDHCVFCASGEQIERLRVTAYWTRPRHVALLWLLGLFPWWGAVLLPFDLAEPLGEAVVRIYGLFLIVANPLSALLLLLLLRQRRVLELPLCGHHARHRRRLRSGLLLAAADLLLGVIWLLWPPDAHHPALHYQASTAAVGLLTALGFARERLLRLPRLASISADGGYRLKSVAAPLLERFGDCSHSSGGRAP